MASLRERNRADGSTYYAVLYRLNGKQTSTSFQAFQEAQKFAELANKFGVENALATLTEDESVLSAITVTQFLNHHVDHLTGVDKNTADRYRAYIRNDIAEPLGELPMPALSGDHIRAWVNGMREPHEDTGKVASSKTVRNKFMFLAGALNAAVPKYIPENPCHGVRLPVDDDPAEMIFLTHAEFAKLLGAVTEFWRPMVEFLVASGARWGEVAALRPENVDLDAGTVRIQQSWKYGKGGYRLGATKTGKSRRTINVPKSVLEKLDLSHEFVFVNRDGGPVRSHGFLRRVWAPAVERAWPSVDENGQPTRSPLRPRVHDLRHTNASWLIQAGVPLPVIQSHLGHESITTTVGTYGHLDRRSMQSAADIIGAALGA